MATKYTVLGLYRDPQDPRLIVPKRIPAMGWTINMGHRFGPLTLVVFCLIVAAVIAEAVYDR